MQTPVYHLFIEGFGNERPGVGGESVAEVRCTQHRPWRAGPLIFGYRALRCSCCSYLAACVPACRAGDCLSGKTATRKRESGIGVSASQRKKYTPADRSEECHPACKEGTGGPTGVQGRGHGNKSAHPGFQVSHDLRVLSVCQI